MSASVCVCVCVCNVLDTNLMMACSSQNMYPILPCIVSCIGVQGKRNISAILCFVLNENLLLH